jgi:hypothetical protein
MREGTSISLIKPYFLFLFFFSISLFLFISPLFVCISLLFSIARVLLFRSYLATPHAQVPTLLDNQQHNRLITVMQKRPKLLSAKDFFMRSNPHSDQKHTNRNFTDRWAMIFCFINETADSQK